MKLFIVLALIKFVWALPQPDNINPKELQDVNPADIYARSDEKEPAHLLQLIEIPQETYANGVPIIEPLNGPEDINTENSIEDDTADELLDDMDVAGPLVENEQDIKAGLYDEIHIVDLDRKDGPEFMALAPSELESIRIYINENMPRELNEQAKQGLELRLNNNDPYLR